MQQPQLSIPIIQLKETADISFFPAKDNPVGLCVVYAMENDTKVCLDFLEKVFKAVSVDMMAETSTFKLKEQEGFSLALHSAFEQHNMWICFGITPEQLGLHFEYQKYMPITFREKTFLWTDSPQNIMEDPNLKKLLWVSLQKLFPKEK